VGVSDEIVFSTCRSSSPGRCGILWTVFQVRPLCLFPPAAPQSITFFAPLNIFISQIVLRFFGRFWSLVSFPECPPDEVFFSKRVCVPFPVDVFAVFGFSL